MDHSTVPTDEDRSGATVPQGSSFWTPERHANEDKQQYHTRLRIQRATAERTTTAFREVEPRRSGSKPLSSTDRARAAAKAMRPPPTEPKFTEPRQRKQHEHPLQDGDGAYTLVGRGTNRRMWLAGISAQRGY